MTEQEFYQKLLAELEKAADADKQLSALLEKIQSGEASFADSAAYWQKFSALIGSVLSQNAAAPGSGLNEEVSYLMLKNGHMRAFEIMSMVQKALDEKQNLHIEPQKPKFPDERARHAAHSLEDTTVSEEVIRRRAENAIANIANTFHDDYVQENAKFRNNAGLKTYITRTTTGKCCAWCTQIAGRYEYGRHPADVFRRHDHCDCIVTYENGRQRTNVWTKKSWNAPVISPDALNFKPTRFTPEQARETERKNLQYKDLTIPGKTDIISTRNPDWMGAPHTEKIPQKNKTTIFKTYKVNGYDNIWSQTYTANAQAMSEYLDNLLSPGKYGTLNRIIIAKKEKLGGIASYAYAENSLYISEELINFESFSKLVNPDYFPARSLDEVIAHELGGHKRHWEAAERFYQANQTKYPDLYSAKIAMESQLQEYVTRQVSSDSRYVANFVSENARKGFESSVPWKRLNELIADVNVRQQQGTIEDKFLSQLVREILEYDANAT